MFQPPWGDWDLDEPFFQSLSQYSKQGKSSLDSVVDAIKIGLEASQNLSVLIQNNPFPAQDLVTALGSLMELGNMVPRAKQNAYNFAMQVVSWIDQVKSAYESSQDFTWTTWRSLRKSRDVINEICLWAYARHKDQRWTQIGNGLRIGKEIDDFKHRLEKSKELFKDLSLIPRINGTTIIGVAIKSVLFRQDEILEEIRKIRQDQLASASTISEKDTKKQTQDRQSFFASSLDGIETVNLTYDEHGNHPCLERTRVAELAEIKDWLNTTSPGTKNFLWLTGVPGCGKSTIVASLVKHCLDEHIPSAHILIDRNSKDLISYVPSISSQFANLSPEIRSIHDRLRRESDLASPISSEQVTKLFFDILAATAKLQLLISLHLFSNHSFNTPTSN